MSKAVIIHTTSGKRFTEYVDDDKAASQLIDSVKRNGFTFHSPNSMSIYPPHDILHFEVIAV